MSIIGSNPPYIGKIMAKFEVDLTHESLESFCGWNENEKYHQKTLKLKRTGQIDKIGIFHLV